ncbi:MAG: hypothetical protein LBI18_07000 [Planctomycetaceae bacterium]|nr:hypothetical protein [Planctomycetaceae bacterium]
MLIAILVAVQIQQTEDTIERTESSSPETIIALQEQIDRLTDDLKLATALRESIPQMLPPLQNDNEKKYLSVNDDQLQSIKINSEIKKTERTNLLQKRKTENAQLEDQIKKNATENQIIEDEINDLVKQIQNQQSENLAQKQSNKTKQNEINNLKQQITQKENKPITPDINIRNETLYLPKLRTSKTSQSIYLILRFNRLYDANSRNDFDSPSDDQLGIPKIERGISVDTSDKSKNEILKLLQPYNAKKVYASIIVYGDSADQFYLVRDILIGSGFEYDLKPSEDSSIWTFSGNSGSQNVQ